MTLAHELDHALEDQAIGFDQDEANAKDDPGLAYLALVEGSATELMTEYLGRHFPPDVAFAGALGGGGQLGEPGCGARAGGYARRAENRAVRL